MNTEMLVILLIFQNMSCYYEMITWMKNANSFHLSKVQPQGVAQHLLDFFSNFRLVLLMKVLLIRKKACSKAYYIKASLMLRVSHNTSIQIKLFILPLKKIVEKQLIIAYPRGKIPLRKIKTKRTMPPENCHRQTPAPREWPPSNKATLQEIQVVFQAQYDRMNYQTSQLRRIARSWMLLVQLSRRISQPGQAYKMGILEKIVNGLKFILRLI